MRVRISSIKINPGRREAEPKAVEELARSITAVGLLNPITIDQNNTLVAGLHRLEAAKLLGWAEIECTAIGMNTVQAELAEIDENIVRTRLNRQELCEQLLRRKEIYEMLNPEIAKLIDRTPSTVGHALMELEAAGLVKCRWISRCPTQPYHTYVKLPAGENEP